jgi:hypothetical protein
MGDGAMIRQYFAQTCRGGHNPLRVGVIATGSIYYLQDEHFFSSRSCEHAVCREPWIVECFLNGQYHAARRDPNTGRWLNVYVSGRSDTAVVRSLRSGRRREIAVRLLQLHEDLALWKEPTTYPALPDLRFHHVSQRDVYSKSKHRRRT